MVEMTTIFFPLRTMGIKACTGMFHVWKSEMGTTAARALFLDHLTSYMRDAAQQRQLWVVPSRGCAQSRLCVGTVFVRARIGSGAGSRLVVC
ncbi:hypothetical protein FHG87_021791 [Trinorchestia longiramus]|nr:hypothetical protein FHG87_021791 [Trinorchestia longiramus]